MVELVLNVKDTNNKKVDLRTKTVEVKMKVDTSLYYYNYVLQSPSVLLV